MGGFSSVRPPTFFDCLSCATDALYAEDLILLPRQFVVVHKKLFELLDELIAEIANDLDISKAMIVLFNRYHAVVSFLSVAATLLSLNNSHNSPLEHAAGEGRFIHEHQYVDGIAVIRHWE